MFMSIKAYEMPSTIFFELDTHLIVSDRYFVRFSLSWSLINKNIIMIHRFPCRGRILGNGFFYFKIDNI